MNLKQPTLSEQELIRREKLAELYEKSINPYPYSYSVSHRSKQILADKTLIRNAETNPDTPVVSVAGRIMTRRIMGKASFFNLQDSEGTIQVYISKNDIGEEAYNSLFKHLTDIGDIVGVSGFVFKTRTEETTIHAESIELLCKALRPIPVPKETVNEQGEKEIHDAFTDREQRYRQRYVDLIVNPDVRETFRKRTHLVQVMRECMNEKGFLEVETPILQPVYGGAAAKPFVTHHNALDTKLYLRIANELYLKRLIVGGFDGVYEFSKDFRNEGLSRFHNPEFTQVELYVAYKDYNWMMEFTEYMLEKVALALHGDTKVPVGDHIIDFKSPWPRVSLFDAIEEKTGLNVAELSEEQLRKEAKARHLEVDETFGKGKLIDELFGEFVEHTLIQPTFIIDYPVEMSPLTKLHRSKPGLVERFECVCNGKEIANSYTELNDPIDQRARFEEQTKLRAQGDEEAMAIDEDFIRALEFGMPPTAGIGIGIDRLSMIMTNSESIRDVLFFPQMKPEA